MTREVSGGSLQQGMRGKNQGQQEVGTHLDHLVRTSRCLLLLLDDFLGKAHLDKARVVLRGRKQMVRLGKRQGLRVAVLELLQVGTARGTARGTALALRDWRGTALELLERDTVLVFQDLGGTHHRVLREVLGIAPALQDQRGTGTAPELPDRTIRRGGSRPGPKAGWELLGLSWAILGLWEEVQGCPPAGRPGWCCLFSLPGSGSRLLKHRPAENTETQTEGYGSNQMSSNTETHDKMFNSPRSPT